MPLYEYQCPDGHVTETYYPNYEDSAEEIPCEKCKKPSPRIVSMTGEPVFGSGYIKTPSKRNYAQDKAKFSKG